MFSILGHITQINITGECLNPTSIAVYVAWSEKICIEIKTRSKYSLNNFAQSVYAIKALWPCLAYCNNTEIGYSLH